MINHWMFKCSEVTKLISKSMDQELTIGQKIGVRIHLALCRYCSRYKKHLELIRKFIKDAIEAEIMPAPPLTLSHQARERMKQRLLSQY